MLSVAPRPGEFIRGHAGRLSVINGFQSAEELLAVLDSKARNGQKGRDPVAAYQLTAPFAGLDPVTYLKLHSLLPFARIGANGDEDVLDYETPARAKQRTAWMQLKDAAYVCPRCVAEDEEMLGYSYWRAFHQAPGIDACEMHGEALAAVKSPGAFDWQPGTWCGGARPVSDELATLREVPIIVRYARITHAFLTGGRRVSRFAAWRCFGNRASVLGFQVGIKGHRSTLADCIRDAFPARWLEAHYPRLYGRASVRNVHSVNGAARAQLCEGIVYAMALAATFSSAEQAIHAFHTTSNDRVRRPRSKYGPLSERRERLLPLYLAAEGKILRVAEMLGVTQSTAFRQLRAVGLPTIGKVPKVDRQRVVAFVSKASTTEVNRWIAAGSDLRCL
ncbi:TniQ family protein [Ralstonia sp. 22111]|uniref:TniQ family protein n=1 Tax=Ralstonia sp. 22111 TaxID=3453878 RepID=UPI003F82E520